MLKLSYTESGLHLERVSVSLEQLIQQRVILALGCQKSLYIEPGRAAFLLPTNLLELSQLESALWREQCLTVTVVDEELVEVSLEGTWIAATAAAQEGIFFTVLSERTEFLIDKLWQATQSQVSSLA
jgi:hypothetical protein